MKLREHAAPGPVEYRVEAWKPTAPLVPHRGICAAAFVFAIALTLLWGGLLADVHTIGTLFAPTRSHPRVPDAVPRPSVAARAHFDSRRIDSRVPAPRPATAPEPTAPRRSGKAPYSPITSTLGKLACVLADSQGGSLKWLRIECDGRLRMGIRVDGVKGVRAMFEAFDRRKDFFRQVNLKRLGHSVENAEIHCRLAETP